MAGGVEWWNCEFSKNEVKGSQCWWITGIQVDTDIEFNGDECANLKWPVATCRKHPHSCIVNSSLYVATQSIVILSQ